MTLTFIASLSAAGLFLGMLTLFEAGRSVGRMRLMRDPDGAATSAGPAEAAVFGLLGLLLAFTFSGAASRFEVRRHLVTEEANAIGTAYLRIDLLPSDAQPEMRQLFRRYLDDRVESHRHPEDATATQARSSDATALQARIWAMAISASQRDASGNAAKVLLPALNEMFDITTTRVMATENHPPRVIFVLLAGLSLVSSLLVGYVTSATKTRNWTPLLILAATLSLTFYVILDLEFPRQGMIRVDAADHILAELRKTMR
ncbi:MAG TPA: DUF4239 domain-containing protein [Accumulibacter sp.]|uniref:bestrophin-like domain n=1 Tax=Accumulibacter sp. TaxID=2053492 RepID=UPI002BF49337|nr:DUF4239 domain-containing protein [Accumulibacter sp.]MCC6506254.1 DUF4239 domain-containing protein [Aquimonas sp.]HMW84350.1 DUF4239 domain-containing protein [Pseudomonadales bacterium]HMW57945.1 DUF4239 domain-containing protein [Accumulibacter sp.]HNE14329.1 DUF4239 domain-containing protein [Accumulibacter sp.]HNM76704.1 DUF4239 domain-containing protein [Accumulibacter sp.]